VAWKVKELSKEKAKLRSQLERAREQGNQEKASLLGWEYENITLNKQAWDLVLSKVGGCEDIPYKSSEGAKSDGLALDGSLAGHLPYSSTCLEPSQTLNQEPNQEPNQGLEYALAGGGGKRKKRRRLES